MTSMGMAIRVTKLTMMAMATTMATGKTGDNATGYNDDNDGVGQ